MTTQNSILADILDREAAEAEPDRLLAALADHGVYIPLDGNDSVMFLQLGDEVIVPGYVSEECCTTRCPEAAKAVHCTAPRLIDIGRQTKIVAMAVFSQESWAKVPLPLLARTLGQRGLQTQTPQTLKLSWTTHPLAIALRDAARDRLPDFPGVRTIWIANAQWLETGDEQLMLHVEVSENSPADLAGRLMETLMSEHVTPTDDDPPLAMRVLNPAREADATAIREINAMGLDTIRINPTTGQVEVISHEYD